MTLLAQAIKGQFLWNSRRGSPEDASRLLASCSTLLKSVSYLSEAVVLCCVFSCDFVAFAAEWCFTGP